MPSKRFGCSSANRREMASWSAASTFRTKRFAAWSAGYMSFCRSTDTRTSGGSSDTDATELAVMPTGRPPGSRVVRTVTPVAKRPSNWRNSAGSTPGMLLPEESSQDTGSEHRARGDDVPVRAHQKIREVRSARQAAHHAIGERRPPDADADESLQQPLSRELTPPGKQVRSQGRGRNGFTDPARQRGDEAGSRELCAAHRAVDPLARKRVEEIRRIADQKSSPARRGGRARPLRERTRDQHVAHQAPGGEPPRKPREFLELREKAAADVPALLSYRRERQHQRHRGHAAADRPEAHVAALPHVQLTHAANP